MVEPSQFKDLFLSEAEDRLQKLNGSFLKLEKDPSDKAILKDLVQTAHSLKSSCAIMGYKRAASLVYVLEDVFGRVREGNLALSPDLIDGVFGVFDALEKSCRMLKTSGEEPSREAGFNLAEEKLKSAVEEGSMGIPETTGKNAGFIGGTEGDLAERRTGRGPTEQSYVKVPTGRLDTLMALAEELAVEKIRLDQLKRSNPEEEDLIKRLGTLIAGIRSQIVQARMVSVSRIFEPLPRLVRDLSRQQGKRVELDISGSELELDRAIIDQAAGPIAHLLINAVDHGIKKEGSIFIRARKKEGRVLIEVEDDGEGIDVEKVKAAAIKKNIIDPERADLLTRDKIIQLLSSYELSTNESIGPISGRGVGLSSVRFFSDKVGGRLSITSPAPSGRGTLVVLDLPLDLAILSVLIVQVKSSFFAIPLSDIESISTVGSAGSAMRAPDSREKNEGPGQIPLIRLEKLFFPLSLEEELEGKPLVTVRSGKLSVRLVVDDLIGKNEIISTPFSPAIGDIKGFSGLTALGGGKSILIFNIPEFLNLYVKGQY